MGAGDASLGAYFPAPAGLHREVHGLSPLCPWNETIEKEAEIGHRPLSWIAIHRLSQRRPLQKQHRNPAIAERGPEARRLLLAQQMMSAAGVVFPQKSGFDRLAFHLDLSCFQTSAEQRSQSLLDREVRQARGDGGSWPVRMWKAACRDQLRPELLAGLDGHRLNHVWICRGEGSAS